MKFPLNGVAPLHFSKVVKGILSCIGSGPPPNWFMAGGPKGLPPTGIPSGSPAGGGPNGSPPDGPNGSPPDGPNGSPGGPKPLTMVIKTNEQTTDAICKYKHSTN